MFLKFKFLLAVIIVISLNSNAQTDSSKVTWLGFDETKNLFEKIQKPVLIFFHDNRNDSSWQMLNQTFGLDEVAKYINILFYPIKINIYTQEDLNFFDGSNYKNNNGPGKIHSLVEHLLGKDQVYPAMILFTKKAEGAVFQGFRDRDRIFPLLIYYAESVYETTTYPEFENEYFKSYPVGQKQIITRLNLKWKNLPEVIQENKTSPKKILINLYDNFSVSATMMRLQTYNNKINADYLNQKFHCINIDLRTKDTLEFLGQKFINENLSHGFHQLPIALLNGKMNLPAFVIFDEEFKFIGREQRYFTSAEFEILIRFVGENAFKTQSLDEFKNNFKGSFDK